MAAENLAGTATGPLVELERELAEGDGATYGRRLDPEAIVVIPNRALDKSETVAEIDAAGGWDGFAINDAREERLAQEVALVSYRFRGHRGAFEYDAWMSSVYRRDDEGDWKLILHQQTPLG